MTKINSNVKLFQLIYTIQALYFKIINTLFMKHYFLGLYQQHISLLRFVYLKKERKFSPKMLNPCGQIMYERQGERIKNEKKRDLFNYTLSKQHMRRRL